MKAFVSLLIPYNVTLTFLFGYDFNIYFVGDWIKAILWIMNRGEYSKEPLLRYGLGPYANIKKPKSKRKETI